VKASRLICIIMFFDQRKKIVYCALASLWGLMALVSGNHLVPFWDVLQLPVSVTGYLAWSTFAVTTIFLGYRHWKVLVTVFLLFFLFGYKVGPFLEPPGDPLDHLRNTYATCGKTTNELKQTNKGLWQYSMVGNILCHESDTLAPKDVMQRIDSANGVFWASSASILFVVGIRSGLPAGWALFSVCIAFLFMGTNRFSYFSYYSFAPSISSLWIFWLWIAAFFFKKQGRYLLPGIVAAGLSLPVLIVNHIQEAVFIPLVCGVWVAFFVLRTVVSKLSEDIPLWKNNRWWILLVTLFVIFFVLPQWPVFQAKISKLFLYDYWQENQEAVFSWQGIHLTGKIWGYRIYDTLGIFGFLPVLLLPLFIISKFTGKNSTNKWQILLLGLLPLIVYCIPLLNYIWLSNCVHLPTHIRYYYRMCYSSLFWLPVALVLYRLGMGLQYTLSHRFGRDLEVINGLFLTFCLICFTVLSQMQSAPVYGKLDFMTVDSRQWWDAWQPMIEEVVTWDKKEIETDYITGYVLHAVFDVPLKYNQFNLLSVAVAPKRNIEKMVVNSKNNDTGCLVNLQGFSPTWIPVVTGHWAPDLSNPELLYQIENKGEQKLSQFLQENPLGSCVVFF